MRPQLNAPCEIVPHRTRVAEVARDYLSQAIRTGTVPKAGQSNIVGVNVSTAVSSTAAARAADTSAANDDSVMGKLRQSIQGGSASA